MTTILHKLEANPASATDAQVEQLAQARYTAGTEVARTDGIYLRVLVAGCQGKLGPMRRGRAPNGGAQLAVIEAIHARFYGAVLRGITTADIAPDDTLDNAERQRRTLERNRRSSFARTAKSTLVAYAKAHGDIRSLDAQTVSKNQLRAAVEPEPVGDKVSQRIVRSEGVLLRAVKRQAREDPDTARETLERTIQNLRKVLDSLDDVEPPQDHTNASVDRPRQHTRTRVGNVMLNRPQVPA